MERTSHGPGRQPLDPARSTLPRRSRPYTPLDALSWALNLACGWTPEHTTGLLFGTAGALLGLCVWWS